MASNPYEVEHNIKAPARPPHRRRPDMATFTSHLHQISRDPPAAAASDQRRREPAGPTPVDAAALFRLVQDQFATLAADAPTAENRRFLESLIGALEADVGAPPDAIRGVGQAYLDELERVPRRALERAAAADDACPICAERFLDDPYPLVVELPCHGAHRFDLECVGPWLQSKGTCPMCRADLTKKKTVEVPKPADDDDEDFDDVDGLYG
ncbi:hypothetical protein GGS23DRAFT_594099 [Durotheca rogersii]|uniref:uncharacterized protein n=1 Tax=Durotheca rogersii TaxID=419775 RepID=UPI002220CFE8|nr:uncharacterized protein GGS23DRAFT_594099 [Durotheca rogersii]KAI5865943.1 hypothetical protein GGS23DRAFT_594099 [Durotheca rogersii]